MRTVRNILTVVAVSAFLFACEVEDYASDNNLIEDIQSSDEDVEEYDSDDEHAGS